MKSAATQSVEANVARVTTLPTASGADAASAARNAPAPPLFSAPVTVSRLPAARSIASAPPLFQVSVEAVSVEPGDALPGSNDAARRPGRPRDHDRAGAGQVRRR